jgi:pimeloyl-ACP methyl ester carboxylesterase
MDTRAAPRLSRRARVSGGEIAWDVVGSGPPLVLVHGTPSWSFLWRGVVERLADRFAIHLWDLLGYGDSEQRSGQDVSIAAQARYLAELLDQWGLDAPAVVGHDIGGAIVLRAHLCEGRPYGALTLVDAVVFNPWTTPTTTHIRRHLDAYESMPAHIYEQVVRAHLRTAHAREPEPAVLDAYVRPWMGEEGQRAYFRKLAQIDEEQTAVLEPLLGTLAMPAQVIWGADDGWLEPALGRRLAAAIPGARLDMVPGAGHFSPEDEPEAVAAALDDFLAGAGPSSTPA